MWARRRLKTMENRMGRKCNGLLHNCAGNSLKQQNSTLLLLLTSRSLAMADKRKTKTPESGIVQVASAQFLTGYAELLEELKTRIRSAQIRAGLAVNRELVLIYWEVGHRILHQQKTHGWGAKVVERLAQDLRSAFPDMKGFSRANLLYMRAFAESYPEVSFVQQTA